VAEVFGGPPRPGSDVLLFWERLYGTTARPAPTLTTTREGPASVAMIWNSVPSPLRPWVAKEQKLFPRTRAARTDFFVP